MMQIELIFRNLIRFLKHWSEKRTFVTKKSVKVNFSTSIIAYAAYPKRAKNRFVSGSYWKIQDSPPVMTLDRKFGFIPSCCMISSQTSIRRNFCSSKAVSAPFLHRSSSFPNSPPNCSDGLFGYFQILIVNLRVFPHEFVHQLNVHICFDRYRSSTWDCLPLLRAPLTKKFVPL